MKWKKNPRNSSGSLELVLSHRQDFLNNHLARGPVIPNKQETMEMKDEVLSSVDAQDMNISGYQGSDVEEVEFCGEKDQMDVDAVFRPGIDAHFSPTAFDELEMGDQQKTPFCSTKGGQGESPLTLTTPVSERPIRPPALLRRRPFGSRNEKVADYTCFNLSKFLFKTSLTCVRQKQF